MAATDFGKAMNYIGEAMMFENWLRFYFIAEEGEQLLIRIPEQAVARIKELYPALLPLVEDLNNKEITPESSRTAVCNYISSELEGTQFKAGLGGRVLDSGNFHMELQLFHTWVQNHEAQLDKAFMDFSTWKEMYADWKKTDEVKAYIEQVREAMQRSAPGTTTQQ